MKTLRFVALALLLAHSALTVLAQAPAEVHASGAVEYKLLATNKTSTMEKELNQAAALGFRFEGVMGGETSFGGHEVVCILSHQVERGRYEYRLLATSKTSTMQKELTEAGARGFLYRGQTVYDSTFGGREVLIILERDTTRAPRHLEYRLQATKKTSTMEKELNQVGTEGFRFCGVTVAETFFGGREVVCILMREAR